MQLVPTDSGKPLRITKVWFRSRFGQSFPDLLNDEQDELLDSCIDAVYTMFSGISDIWSYADRETYCNKTRLCYGLLVAWYITDVYPQFSIGALSSGGIPIRSKTIGGTTITFASEQKAGASNNANLLASLKSNVYGAKAYFMIKASGRLNFYLQR
jgi:hypothetical protein